MSKLLNISDEWSNLPIVNKHLKDSLSKNQRDLMTPIVINSNNIDGFRRAFVELFKQTGLLFSPLSFRYSYSFNVSGKRNVTIVPKYYLEKDINIMLSKYKIVTHVAQLVPTGADWEVQALEAVKFFEGDGASTYHKLIKTRVGTDEFIGWECKELFQDKPVL